MKERPIIFSGEMVRALLESRKTQTRRLVKITHQTPGLAACLEPPNGSRARPEVAAELCPYGQPGDRLWVRETHHVPGGYLEAALVAELLGGISTPESLGVTYRADAPAMTPCDGGWRASIHMPRWASRITLEVTSVRVERLQEISSADAIAEGGPPSHSSIDPISRWYGYPDFSRSWFAQLWESINGPESWDANPWVWVIEFRRLPRHEPQR